MPVDPCEIVVAGHVCLDVIPTFLHQGDTSIPAFRPGHLVHVGPAVRSTGGAVSNTGRALHRLGIPVRLLGKIGDDLFGEEILRLLREQGPQLADGMVRVPGEVTSYSIVLNPPGIDRTFLHCPGANDTFSASDVELDSLADAKLFHFGYPPIMRGMYANGGSELVTLLERVRGAGLTVSLDLCMVDENSEAGRVDWKTLLSNALPHIDLFCPSVDELLYMLEPDCFRAAIANGGFDIARHVDHEMLLRLSSACLDMGAGIVAIKLGDQGLYLRTSSDRERLKTMGRATPEHLSNWCDRELHTPCFVVDVAGTTGSGDATIAGLLAAFVRGEQPSQILRFAVAVGAASVEAADAVSGVGTWRQITNRINDGWSLQPSIINLPK